MASRRYSGGWIFLICVRSVHGFPWGKLSTPIGGD